MAKGFGTLHFLADGDAAGTAVLEVAVRRAGCIVCEGMGACAVGRVCAKADVAVAYGTRR